MKYKLCIASGNPTALVHGQVDKAQAIKILAEDPRVEQVGFLSGDEKTGYRLDMAGGEFCGNATRSAVFEFAKGKPCEMEISVSGCDSPIRGGVNEDGTVWAEMPEMLGKEELPGGITLVRLPGITHAVLGSDDTESFEAILETIKNIEKNVPAIGIIGVKNGKMYPVVWVRSIDTLCRETACGSGITAAAYAFDSSLKLMQPWGEYLTAELQNGKVTLTGPVQEI